MDAKRNFGMSVTECSRCGEVVHVQALEDAKVKLAALVKAAEPFSGYLACDGVHHSYADRHDQRDTCPVVGRLRAAIADAKVQQ